jgi:CzcA family heavy metal efflux pump
MTITGWIRAHKRSVLFLLIVLILSGAVSITRTPVSLFPHIAFPRIVVNVDAGDMPAGRTVIEVTRPIEQRERALPNVLNVRSKTSRGSCDISINFSWGTNMVQALLLVQGSLNQLQPDLPPGTHMRVRRMDPTVTPVIGYSLTSSTDTLSALRDFANYQLRPLLSSIDGVANIKVLGGRKEEYQVDVDMQKLSSYKMSINDLVNSLARSNVVRVVGRMEENYKLYLLLSDTVFKNPDQIGNTVIKTINGLPIFINDVASVKDSTAPEWTRVTANGHDAVLINVYQQPGGNTVRIDKEIKAALNRFKAHIPASMKLSKFYDQSELIVSSIASVRDAILIGIGLSFIVLMLFLKNFKMSLIVAITVPSVISATILMLYVFHLSFNIMTLGGLAAAVGLIIDDAIVMVENITRWLKEKTMSHHRAVIAATREMMHPLAGSSATTIIVFAPLAFLSGITGGFFKALSVTMASALFISFLIALIAIPLISGKVLTEKDAEGEGNGPIFRKVLAFYAWTTTKVLRRPLWISAVALILIAAGYLTYRNIGTGFLPKMDEGAFILDYRAEPGTSLTETDRLLKQIEGILTSIPEVDSYSRRTGLQLGGGITEANSGDFLVHLKPQPRRSIDRITDEIRSMIKQNVPGVEVAFAQLMEDLIGDLTAVPQPIEIKIYGDNGRVIRGLAKKAAGLLSNVRGVVDIFDGITIAGDSVDIRVNRLQASLHGLDPEAVTKIITTALKGTVATQVERNIKMVDVRVRTPESVRDNILKLGSLSISTPEGHQIPLSRIASFTRVTGQPEITRENLKQMVAVTARISGRDMGSTMKDVKKLMAARLSLPPGVTFSYGGLYREQQKSFRDMALVLIAAIVLVALVLLFLYENYTIPLAIIFVDLLSLNGVFIGLWLTNTSLNISSLMGLVMFVGIVAETAIIYMAYFKQILGEVEEEKSALIKAGMVRLKPIIMTTTAAIFALLPLALGIGQGSAMLKPLAVAIISGFSILVPLIFFVLPSIYLLLSRYSYKG